MTAKTKDIRHTGETLSRRALNRALLARQLLLERAMLPPKAAIEHLIGLQAQAPSPPFTGLWTRLHGFDPEEVSRLLLSREVVRLVVMRGTVHLVSARDARLLRPLVQPSLSRMLLTRSTYGKPLNGLDLEAVVASGRRLLEDEPRTLADLRKALAGTWPDRDPTALGAAVHYLTPLVQLPPRGLWKRSGQPVCTTLEDWLGEPMEAAPSIDAVVLRYLRAFGPASVADVQTWSGISRLREVMERLRPELVTVRDERGRELLDLPDAPRPDPGTPAPIRFIPEFDNLLLSHDDRTRIIADDHRRGLMTRNGIVPGTILIDGFAGATWRLTQERTSATLTITPFAPLATEDRRAIEEEGSRLLAFSAADAETKAIAFVSA